MSPRQYRKQLIVPANHDSATRHLHHSWPFILVAGLHKNRHSARNEGQVTAVNRTFL
jgi:hypothetical protein